MHLAGHSYALLVRACSTDEAGRVAAAVLRRVWEHVVVREFCKAESDTWEWYALRCPHVGVVIVVQIMFPAELYDGAKVMRTEVLSSDEASRLLHTNIREWVPL
jgi:hypothetical protein